MNAAIELRTGREILNHDRHETISHPSENKMPNIICSAYFICERFSISPDGSTPKMATSLGGNSSIYFFFFPSLQKDEQEVLLEPKETKFERADF